MDKNTSVVRDIDILTGQPMLGDVGGEPLFVINLCAAMTPQNLDGQVLPGLEHYKLYQVSRIEDGRRRYRLRLGFFTTEGDAEDVLESVRKQYATAFTACLCDEDLKHASGYLNRSIQDLARTGRFNIKPRQNANGATTTADTTIIRGLKAVASPVIDAKPSVAEPVIAAKTAVNQPSANTLAPKQTAVKANAVAPDARSLPATQSEKSTAPSGGMMRRAHALEALATARGDRQLMATGKYPAQPTIPAAAQPAIQTAAITSAAQPRAFNSAASTATPASKSTAPLKLEVTTPVHKNPPPFHVGAGVEIPETNLSLAPADAGPVSIQVAIATIDAPVAAKAAPAPTISPIVTMHEQTAQKIAQSAEVSHMEDLMRARELAKQSSAWREQHGEIPTLDTTQTIRTLTKKEIDDVSRPKWFIVQLAASDHPVNLDAMPRLDIFEAYNLYSVAIMNGDHIRHALRLGFFREEVSAQAVLGYLKTFFNDPTIERIADAEHDRFANSKAKLAPRPENTPKTNGTVVELEQKRPATHANAVPMVSASVTRPNPQSKPMSRAAAPATKSAPASTHTAARKPAAGSKNKTGSHLSQRDLLEEARSLGLSETAIHRVQKNPSLLSRLVGKLTK